MTKVNKLIPSFFGRLRENLTNTVMLTKEASLFSLVNTFAIRFLASLGMTIFEGVY